MTADKKDVQHDLLTVKETAIVFKVSERTIWRWIKQGKIKCIRFQGIVRIRRPDIEKILGS